MSRFYVVSAVMPWRSIKVIETGLPIRDEESGSAGYMVVYTTRAAAEAYVERAAGSPAGNAAILEFDDGRGDGKGES